MSGYTKLLIFGLAILILALGLEVRNRMTIRKNLGKMSLLRDEAELTLQSLAARLQSPDSCSDALGGQFIKPGDRAPIAVRFVLDSEAEPDAEAIAPGVKISTGGLRVAHLNLVLPKLEDMRTVILDSLDVPTELHRFQANLELTFRDAEGKMVPLTPAGDAATIPLFVWTLPPPPIGNGQIVSCFRPESAGRLCNDLGGYFIPHASPYDQSCRMSLKTLKREHGKLIAAANCRIGGLVSKPSECRKYGVKYGANQLQGDSQMVPAPGAQYLCQICQ